MKYCLKVKSSVGSSRLGLLSCYVNSSNEHTEYDKRVFQSPMCLMYTRNGCVPHISHEVLMKQMSPNSLASSSFLLPLSNLAESHKSVAEYGKGIGKFVGIDESYGAFSYVCLHDPVKQLPSGFSEKGQVSIWTAHGRLKLSPEQLISIQESFTPDIYQSLADTDVHVNSSKKRNAKSIDRTIEFLDECLELHLKSSKLRTRVSLLGTVVGGHDVEARMHSAKLTASRPVSGFVIDGICASKLDQPPSGMKFEDYARLIDASVKELPEDKPKFLQGPFRPDFVLGAIDHGIDVFDSSYAHVVSERGGALCFIDAKCKKDGDEATAAVELDLRNRRYAEDLRPLVEGCDCYACRNFTRSYVHHLLDTAELLAGVLLSVHNLEYYSEFFRRTRSSIEADRFSKFRTEIQNAFNDFDR